MKRVSGRIIVVGGGPAGFCAAISAARLGGKVTLIEQRSFLGGNSVIGLCLHTFHSMDGKQVVAGLPEEIVKRLKELDGSTGWVEVSNAHMKTTTPINSEIMRCLIVIMLQEAGVEILLNAKLSKVSVRSNRICNIEVATVGGTRKINGDIFVDATGEGELAFLTGVPYKKGREKDGFIQPMSLLFKLGGVKIERFLAEAGKGRAYAVKPGGEKPEIVWFAADLASYNDLLEAEGLEDFMNREIWGNSICGNEYNMNITRIPQLDSTIPTELSKAEVIGLDQVYRISSFMRKYINGFEDSHIVSIAPFVGVRESRRILGKYILTAIDVLEGRKFEDGILRGGYPIDIHEPGGTGILFSQIKENGYYHIPYRCLLPEKIENLIVAGRCISATHEALAATRVMINCMGIGQAAGTAATLAVKSRIAPAEVNVSVLRDTLQQNGVLI